MGGEENQGVDRIVELRVAGVRSVRSATLSLGPLTVLVGPNGGGKSTLLECLELLRVMADTSAALAPQITQAHGGLGALLSRGESVLRIGVTIEGGGAPIRYDVALSAAAHGGFRVMEEQLRLGPRKDFKEPLEVICRDDRGEPQYFDQPKGKLIPIPHLSPIQLAIHAFGNFPPNDAITRLLKTLSSIAVHVPFEVRPAWARPGELPALRRSNIVQPAEQLERFGANLANVWFRLKNDFGRAHWDDTMLEVRMGLGEDVEDVSTQADAGGGQVALKVRYRGRGDLPAFVLSDGTLAYLAFVALRRLAQGGGGPSLVAFDEPELHLHPELLVRVVGMFEAMSDERTVVLATHSDRVLDVLSDPASSVVLCELGPDRATRLRRPDADALASWLDEYRGLGHLRAEGYEDSVFAAPPDEDAAE